MNPKFMISDPANSSHSSESETQILQRRHVDFLSNNSLSYLGDDFRERLQQIIGQFVDRRFKTCEGKFGHVGKASQLAVIKYKNLITLD